MSLLVLCMLCFTFSLCPLGTSTVVNPVGPTITSDYSRCMLSLADDNFRSSGLLVVANTYNASAPPVAGIRTALLMEVHRAARHTVQVVSPAEEAADGEEALEVDSANELQFRPVEAFVTVPEADYYVVVVGGFTQFKRVVMKLSTLRTWNPRAIFLIVCFRVPRADESVARYPELMLTHLFLLNVVNAVVLVTEPSDERRIGVYGWRPFEPPQYCGYKNETAAGRLILQNACSRGVVEHHDYMFEDKIPKSMAGCAIKAIALVRRPFVNRDDDEFPGIERILMDEVAAAMRLEVRYSSVRMQRGEKDPTGEWTGALARLKAGKGDFVFGAVFPDNDVHEDYEASASYFSDSYAWVVPRAEPSPPWVALVVIFERRVWLSALCTYAVCVCSWRLLGQWSGEAYYHRMLSHCTLNAWYTTLGGSAYMRPRGHSLRIFFIFFTLYCVLFLTAYQTKLIDVLTNPSFEAQLSTPADLVRSDLRWGGFEELNDLFDDATDELDRVLGGAYVDVDDEVAALTDVAVHRNFSFLSSRLSTLDASARSDAFGDNFFTFEENVFSIPAEFVTLVGFPLMGRMNGIVGAFQQMGVMQRILAQYAALTARRRAHLGTAEGARRLSLQHLQGGFLVLAAGYLGGALALALELLVSCESYRNLQLKVMQALKGKRTEAGL